MHNITFCYLSTLFFRELSKLEMNVWLVLAISFHFLALCAGNQAHLASIDGEENGILTDEFQHSLTGIDRAIRGKNIQIFFCFSSVFNKTSKLMKIFRVYK